MMTMRNWWSGGRFGRRLFGARSGRRSTGLLFILIALAFPASATITGSAITGRVVIAGAPAAGVTVTASSSVLQHPRTTITGPRGTYWLGALPPGEYDVTFSLAGHTTVTRRALVELARVARADATLEPNADEETVTSTATTVSVAGTTAITTHFDDETLDRLPVGREAAEQLAPDPFFPSYGEVDGTPSILGFLELAEDVVEQTTVVRGGAPVEYATYAGKAVSTLTRRGGEDFFFSLRDTLTSNAWIEGNQRVFPAVGDEDETVEHMIEATGGGRIVSQRLWFFAGAWGGDRAPYGDNIRGLNAKLHAQLGPAHHLDGGYIASESAPTIFFESETSHAWLRHTAALGPRLTWETHAARVTSNHHPVLIPAPPPARSIDVFDSRASYVVPTRGGDHVLTAGAAYSRGDRASDYRAFFAGDRWSVSRWVVNAGVRYDDTFGDGRITPRVAVTYDPRGDGTRAISATYGEYGFGDSGAPGVHLATLGYATAIGRSGSARVDVLRRWRGGFATDSLQLDTRYRLFDRFEAGATYTYDRVEDSGDFEVLIPPRHQANAWIGAELPLGPGELGATILQRYIDIFSPPFYDDSFLPTDVALRYSLPLSRVGLMFAADAINVFSAGEAAATIPRALRFWVRLRV